MIRKAALLAFGLWLSGTSHALAQDDTTFAVDLADRQISITTGFNGADLLVFGAISRGKVILSIEGKNENYQVRKKNRVGGIWLNNESRKLRDLPNFYAIASSQDALEHISDQERLNNRIGYDAITGDLPIFDAHGREFFQSLVKIKEENGLYQIQHNKIQVSPSGLFRVNIQIPASVPPGDYTIRALSVENGKVLQKYQTAMSVNKVGFGAQIYNAAYQYPKLYGIGAIIISVLSGLLASFVFNRRKA